MALDIGRNGMVQRHEDGSTTVLRPNKNGGPGTEIEVPAKIADTYRLATGDIVDGDTEPTFEGWAASQSDDESLELHPDWDTQYDEPSSLRGSLPTGKPLLRRPATERLIRISRINGLGISTAEDRPSARTNRSRSERVPPDRLLALATSTADYIGRTLDYAAPLGAGVFGLIYGAHGTGLSRTLQSALKGIVKNAPDCVPMVLLLRPRAEEATEYRRQVPEADIVVASSAFSESTPEQTLRLCSLVLEAAQRQTELGKDVVLVVDSLTGIWAALLEAEHADAQHEADTAAARQRIREWVQKAGCFHGEGLLGGGVGGSLTIIGIVWNQAVDIDAEESRETHPHLRLLEHVLPEASWVVSLSETLMLRRLFPAIDVTRCRSQYEEKLLSAAITEKLLLARGALPRHDPVKVHLRVMDALDKSVDLSTFVVQLTEMNAVAIEAEKLISERAEP